MGDAIFCAVGFDAQPLGRGHMEIHERNILHVPLVMSEREKHLETRLKALHTAVRKMRNAQSAYFSRARVASEDTRQQFLSMAKKAEGEVDGLLKMLEFEKLV